MVPMGIPLSTIAGQVPGLIRVAGEDVLVSDITHDSRQVVADSLFVAVTGEMLDGHDFVESACERGATAFLVEREQTGTMPQIVVRDSREAMPWAARSVFGEPDTSLRLAGVTGTNGKTTVAYMIESMLRVAQIPAGVVGTLGARVDGTPLPLTRTTPEATDLQRLLASMRDGAVETVIMEVSSHALELHRVDAVHFDVVGFTNLSHDHLDFHGDMESYFAVKAGLFRSAVARTAVVNLDDPWGRRLVDNLDMALLTVSVEGDAEITASQVVSTVGGTSFTVKTPTGEAAVELPLAGGFNVSNALVAVGMATELGIDLRDIAEGLDRLEPIPGRMEMVAHRGPFTIVVDYAHTPDALEVVLRSAGQMARGRVIVVFGAGGDRDREKRFVMGSVAAQFSDIAIVTTDNPRSEDPVTIAIEVRRGADDEGGAEIETVIDRRQAIRRAIDLAAQGDLVLILGKGHEQGQDIGSEVLPFDDRHEVTEALVAAGWIRS